MSAMHLSRGRRVHIVLHAALSLLCLCLLLVLLSLHPIARAPVTVWVVSHRRSGTHLTLDLLSTLLPRPYRLIKTNHIFPSSSAHADAVSCGCLAYMRETGHIVHAHRDVRDVVVSMYYYYRTFSPRFMRNISREQYYANKDGVRDRVIGTWVNTTAPWFAEHDVVQIDYADAASGLAHVRERLMRALRVRARAWRPENGLENASGVVAKFAGKGAHGYKIELEESVQRDIMQTARSLETQRQGQTCQQQRYRNWRWRRNGFWVGGHPKYRLWAPSECPDVLKTSTVVMRARRRKACAG